jgi:thioesterase domain-containing protein
MKELAPEERLDLILKLGREAGTLAPAFGPRELGRLVRVVGANQQALHAYRPQPLATRLVYLKAADHPLENHAAWARLALGGVEVQEVPGDHLSMHLPPHVETLAARLGAWIDAALRETVEETDREA